MTGALSDWQMLVIKFDFTFDRPGRGGFDFIGSVENFEHDFRTLLLTHLRRPDLLARLDLETRLDTERHRNAANHNVDRCGKEIRPTAATVASLRPILCALMESDYACFAKHYGTCASSGVTSG